MLKNLKSLFVVVEAEENDKPPSKAIEKSESKEKKTPPPLPKSPAIPKNTSGVVDDKIIEKLLQAIEKNNLDGFDYLEYKKALKALEKMPMDEATKYRSAFATAATMGVTLYKLVETTAFYIGVLDKENEVFINAFKNQFDTKVSGREQEISQFKTIINEKSEQIKKLTEEIAKHQQQINVLENQVKESNSKIMKTQNDFKHSYTHLKSQLEEDITKMNKYLK